VRTTTRTSTDFSNSPNVSDNSPNIRSESALRRPGLLSVTVAIAVSIEHETAERAPLFAIDGLS
jgi:hypothetical protein